MDLEPLNDRLGAAASPRYWRSLEEYAQTDEFRALLRDEFPSQLEIWEDPVGRRHFLKLMGASLALAGVTGCTYQPPEAIVPYTKAPENYVPGKPVFYATALTLGGYATGVLVESTDYRPTKIEGNPDHPASLGGSDPIGQAELLTFYDPDRAKLTTRNGRISTWNTFVEEWVALRAKKLRENGKGVRFLTRTITSPTAAHLLYRILLAMPEARWHQHEPVGRESSLAGAQLAFGEPVEPVHHIDKADVIATFDADFLSWGPGRLADARRWAQRRDPGPADPKQWTCNRLYSIETMPTITGAMADHRLALGPIEVAAALRSLAAKLEVETEGEPLAGEDAWINVLADDLKKNAGKGLVLVGETQPAALHALAHAINAKLGNIGKTVEFIEPVAYRSDTQGGSLADLAGDIEAGLVDTLFILGGNPAYDAPVDLGFAGLLEKVPNSYRFGLHDDETAAGCRWLVPLAHELESWGDARAFDGTVTIQQPLIQPLYKSPSLVEVLAAIANGTTTPGRTIVQEYWKPTLGEGEAQFEVAWRKALYQGVVPNTASKPKAVSLKAGKFGAVSLASGEEGTYQVQFRPDPSVWDGMYANNGWLQELPKSITKLTWDNAAMMSPETAGKLRVSVDTMELVNDVVELTVQGRKLRLPVWIVPGHAENTITVHLGYGRTKAGRIGDGIGSNAYSLRTIANPWAFSGAKVRKVDQTYRLATTQHFQNIDVDNVGAPLNANRHLIRYGTVAEFAGDPHFAQAPDHHVDPVSNLYREAPGPRFENEENGAGNRWAMSINLNTCIGCNACVVACNAENNIPVVGKNQVLRSRAMHWLRIDRYYENPPHSSAFRTHFQPIPCMQCEKAPCELVCPFAATVHDAEGINTMVYNRCAGTKFCSNNCPYKVRRFNFLVYNDYDSPSLKLMRNPEVTVRSRGVMEKCTYCVQRLWAAKINAEKQRGDTKVLDGEVVTACQGACPTRAITFGNWNDSQSAIARAKKDPRDYALLGELNTQPRTTYLAKLFNPNPAIKEI